MIRWDTMKVKRDAANPNVVGPEICGGCQNFNGFGCERSPIVTKGEELCPCDKTYNIHDRTNVYKYNCSGQPQQCRKDGPHDP